MFFFLKNSKKVSKNAEFDADFESVEKVVKKMHQKKVISKTSLTNMSKSEKSAFFRHVFANNFFLVHFFKPFDTFFEFFKKFFLKVILVLFSNFDCMRRKRLKKTENLFL
jgi:hypothetical protein